MVVVVYSTASMWRLPIVILTMAMTMTMTMTMTTAGA
jgi:hypothetical protein